MPELATVFDSLAATEAERESLSRLRAATEAVGGPMERHCLRLRHIAAEIATQRGWSLDGELLTVAAILHDIGLYPGVSTGGVYTADGAILARSLLRPHGWSDERIDLCAEAIDHHHELRRQKRHEVEVIRLADLSDVSGGRLRFGLSREWMVALRRSVPVTGFGGELAREVGRALVERPLTLPRVFLRG